MTNKERIKDRITACLLAGALGDALGYPVEFMQWGRIQDKFGKDGIREPELNLGKALVSDDTQMTLFTAEGIIDRARDGAEYDGNKLIAGIYNAYLWWLKTQGFSGEALPAGESRLASVPELNCLRAPGNTCLSALMSGKAGAPEKSLNNSKGCGGVMRTAPLGFVPGGEDGAKKALIGGARAAALTHGHQLGWIPAGMLSDIVWRCIYGEQCDLGQIVDSALEDTAEVFAEYDRTEDLVELMKRAIWLAKRPVGGECETASVDEPALRSIGEGWVGEEALAVAVYAALRYSDDLEGGLITAVNHSGDSDSTGAIAGNILGAYLGMSALPAGWAEKLDVYGAIIDTADRLAEALS